MIVLLYIFISIVIGALFAWMYLLPGKIALNKNYPRTPLLMMINIAAGWTVIGWLATFIWALAAPRHVR